VHLTAAGPPASLYVFNVTGAELANAAGHGLSITAPAGSTVVVNVAGAASALASMGITLNGVDRQHVLYNFFEAQNLTINAISVEGTVLAPLATVNFVNGQINGTLIANHLTGSGESHLHLFEGTLPTVPEPGTCALGALGMAIVVGLQRRRRWR
jgi:choice-of-anchor A domain-containing protein